MSTNYFEKVMRIQQSGLIGYWPLNEESGTVAYDYSTNGYNATTKGLARGWNDRRMLALDGGKCAQFDGSSSAVDFSGAQTDEPTTEGSLSIWLATEDLYLGGTTAMYIAYMAADANNYIKLSFDTTANQFEAAYNGGSTEQTITKKVYNEPDTPLPKWSHHVLTWSATNDALNYYVNGVAQTAVSSLGTWAGSMDTDLMCLGSSAYATPADQFTGWLAHFALWTPILSQTEVDMLYDIGP